MTDLISVFLVRPNALLSVNLGNVQYRNKCINIYLGHTYMNQFSLSIQHQFRMICAESAGVDFFSKAKMRKKKNLCTAYFSTDFADKDPFWIHKSTLIVFTVDKNVLR